MEFVFSEEQDQFRDVVRKFCADRSPTTEVRRLMDTSDGFDPDFWRRLAAELGVTALQIPPEHGGSGFGPVELCIVAEEFGRALVCAPFFSSTVLATNLIMEGGSPEIQEELLPGLADGSLRGAYAQVEADGSWKQDGFQTRATGAVGAIRLQGSKQFVIDGATADFIIVAASSDHDTGLYLVAGDSAGLTRTPVAAMDPTRKLATLEFSDTPARHLGSDISATDAIARTMDVAALALANEMVGGAQALLDSAVAYAKMRVQFGRTIGSFQAIKHKCADMLLDVESARSAAYCAAAATDTGDPDAAAFASLAKAAASDAYIQTARETIQIHGGIGFTWENDTHLWFKRAKSSEVMLGDPTMHREQLMQRWGY